MVRAPLARLLAWLPGQCAVCRAWPAAPLCAACLARFARPVPRCRSCALPLLAGGTQCGACLRAAPPLDACLAAVSYGYPWDELIARFKFRAEPGWAGALAQLLRTSLGVADALAATDLLLPMPLAPARLRERGYNQALELARHLAPAKTDAHLLLRTRDAPPQSALPRAQRERNVRGAYALAPQRADALRGRRVLLLDDVMTSGASLAAAAQALRAAGAAHITGLVLARTA